MLNLNLFRRIAARVTAAKAARRPPADDLARRAPADGLVRGDQHIVCWVLYAR